jgi:hypothetical protein
MVALNVRKHNALWLVNTQSHTKPWMVVFNVRKNKAERRLKANNQLFQI